MKHRGERAASRLAVAALAIVSTATLDACTSPVAVDLAEAEANRVVAELERNGVAADKSLEPGGDATWRVEVGRLDSTRAVRVLSAENLPRDRAPGLREVLEDGAIVPSRAAEHARLLLGTAGELERSLESVAGVLSARVHLAVARRDPLAGSAALARPTASVLITYRGKTPPITGEDVRRLVAGAVQELSTDAVNVVQAHAEPDRSGEDALARFGPFTTSASALPKLRLLLGGAALLNIVLVAAVLALWSRHRGARRSVLAARGGLPL
jgi:type III secretion protein J